MALPGQLIPQSDFGAGIFRGRRAPRGSVYDAINVLVDDERLLYRRGGSAYFFDSDAGSGGSLVQVAVLEAYAGQRVVGMSSLGSLFVTTLAGTPVRVDPTAGSGGFIPVEDARPVRVGAFSIFNSFHLPGSVPVYEVVGLYAGAMIEADYSTGTASVTAGSKTVTGAGTTWTGGLLANVGKGSLITFTGSTVVGVVESVDSTTQLTLAEAWSGGTLAGVAYDIGSMKNYDLTSGLIPDGRRTYVAAVGSPGRLLVAYDNIVRFSPAGSLVLAADDFHEIPEGGAIRGITGFEDSAVVFRSDGVWTIGNMALDALDDFGNLQRPISKINGEVILWGEPGIAAWSGALVVPALDDVYVLGLGGAPTAISEAIRPLYRDYVAAGYSPGIAEVVAGHYFLPIVDNTGAVQDVLVCRLDLRSGRGGLAPAWTRLADHAASAAYAAQATSSEGRKLLGISARRVTDLSGVLAPSASVKSDADGTDHQLQVVTQDFVSGAIEHTFTGARVALELVDAGSDDPTFEVEYASGPVETETWTSADTRGEGDGERPETFRFARKVRALRLRITTTGAAARAVLRSVEVAFRQRGRG